MPIREGALRCSAVVLLLLCACTGCASSESTWAFALSREAYSGLGECETGRPSDTNWNSDGTGEQRIDTAVLLLPFLALPLVADLLMLPVTGVHDLLSPVLPSSDETHESDDSDDGPQRPTPPPPRPTPEATVPVTE